MGRCVLRFRTGLLACAAVLVSVVSVSTSTSASAAQATPASAAGIPGGFTYQAQVQLINAFNSECLDGREGTGNVTVQTCYTDGTHEYWIPYQYTYYSATFENVFNQEYLDSREGTGNVTVQPGPNNDGLHEYWNPA